MAAIEKVYYNEELKKRYIKEKQKQSSVPNSYIDTQFRKASEYEYEIEKDICNWSTYDIIEYLRLLNVTSADSLICLCYAFGEYTDFCLENNLVNDNQNHFHEFDKQKVVGCINKAALNRKIVSQETIYEWVNVLPNPKDKFIILALFEFGKSKDFKDIVYARIEDLNPEKNELVLADRTVKISYRLKSIIYECEEMTEYYSITGKGVRVMPLADHGYIVKSYPNQNMELSDFQKGRNIYITCQRIFNFLGVGEYMSANYITESGKIHMINERSKELGITAEEYIYSSHVKELEKQFNFTLNKFVFFKKYKDYLNA